MNYFDEVAKKNRLLGSALCLGLDFSSDFLHQFSKNGFVSKKTKMISLLESCSELLLEQAKGKVSAVKIQSAYYERFGSSGYRVLEKLVILCKEKDLLVVLDAKRSDIGTTMIAYLEAAFDFLDVDALTVVPFFGREQIEVCLNYQNKGRGFYFVTLPSNPSGFKLNHPRLAKNLKVLSDLKPAPGIGIVLGATHLSGMEESSLASCLQFPCLLPGLGAQGGRVSACANAGLPRFQDLVPVSRAILGPGNASYRSWEDWAELAGRRISDWTKALAFPDP